MSISVDDPVSVRVPCPLRIDSELTLTFADRVTLAAAGGHFDRPAMNATSSVQYG